jgi:hypothetical protein
VALLYPISRWFVTKMYLQYAKFPMQFRLSQWEGILSEEHKKDILNYVNSSSHGNHLLIFGGRGSGKTPLSVGIATEFSIKRHSCSYYTATKLFSLLALNNNEIMETEKCEVWSWRTASILVIDDINPGEPIPDVFISPEEVESLMNLPVNGSVNQNKSDLAGKNVIWVLGDESQIKFDRWKNMVMKLGVPEEKVIIVNLDY